MSAGKYIPRATPRPERLKRCAICHDWWPITCYSRDRQHPDGHDNRCRDCRGKYRRARGEYGSRTHAKKTLTARASRDRVAIRCTERPVPRSQA